MVLETYPCQTEPAKDAVLEKTKNPPPAPLEEFVLSTNVRPETKLAPPPTTLVMVVATVFEMRAGTMLVQRFVTPEATKAGTIPVTRLVVMTGTLDIALFKLERAAT